jgi:hypothetical protein
MEMKGKDKTRIECTKPNNKVNIVFHYQVASRVE